VAKKPSDGLSREERRIRSIEAARQRRVDRAATIDIQTQWFIKEVCGTVSLSLKKRVRIATELVKNKIIRNISRPVTKTVKTHLENGKPVQRTVVSDRSKKGEFPKADTTQLMKTIFSAYEEPGEGNFAGFVGTPLDYGVMLETLPQLDRSFLVRTLNEERDNVMAILSGPIK
jgi:hypothetical protein